MADVLIIIPAYNEEKNIERVLDGIAAMRLDIDVLVINDGSVDDTEHKALAKGVHLISHPTNLGYGAALQTGFKYARKKGYRFIVQFDADDQHNPEDLIGVVRELKKGEADVVIGSRYLGDPNYDPGLAKKTAVALFQFLIAATTGKRITDPTSGLRGLSRRVFSHYSVKNRFPADYPDADILIQMLKYKFVIQEVPIHSRERTYGVSMHSGIKPVIYLAKILLSIASILLGQLALKRGGHR